MTIQLCVLTLAVLTAGSIGILVGYFTGVIIMADKG